MSGLMPWHPEYGIEVKPSNQTTNRQSAYKDMPGLLEPRFRYSHLGSPGVGFMQNSAPVHLLPTHTGHDEFPWIAGGKRRELTDKEKQERDARFRTSWNEAVREYFNQKRETDVYNKAYKTGYTGQNHLGSLLSADGKTFNLPEYEWQSKNKRPFEQAYFDWGENGKGLTTRTVMDYARGAKVDRGDLYEVLYKAMAAGQADRNTVNDFRTLERRRWDDEDAVNTKRAAIEEEYKALMDQMRRSQEEQARYMQAYNVASQARQRRMADKFSQRFEGDKAMGGSGGGNEAASQKLLSVKPRGTAPKLGSREKLGARSLLGG